MIVIRSTDGHLLSVLDETPAFVPEGAEAHRVIQGEKGFRLFHLTTIKTLPPDAAPHTETVVAVEYDDSPAIGDRVLIWPPWYPEGKRGTIVGHGPRSGCVIVHKDGNKPTTRTSWHWSYLRKVVSEPSGGFRLVPL